VSRLRSDTEMAIARLAAAQDGVVGKAQLRQIGLGTGAIKHRLGSGRYFLIHPGVYAVGHPQVGPRGSLIAALIAGGPSARAAGLSAARLWALGLPQPVRPDIVVRSSHAPELNGVTVHRARRLDDLGADRREGLPVTGLTRTLLDLAEVVRPRQLERALDEAQILHGLRVEDLRRAMDHAPGRRGLAPLNEILARENTSRTYSQLEERFLALVRGAALPEPEVNARVAGYLVDFVWRQERLVVETDGARFHAGTRRRTRDARRDTALEAAGYRVLRLDWDRVVRRPLAVAAELGALLDRVG
jgi:very-short-patch-repair endonuclease